MATIIIAEKPDACEHIARALAESGLKKKKSEYGVNYFEFNRKKKKHIAISAVGHLFTLKQNAGKGWTYPIFNVHWIPSYEARKSSEFSKKYFFTIKEFANGKNDFISACDYDNEGSLIAYNILKYIFNVSDAKRMKFSTLTKQDIVKAYEEMMKHLDFENIECGETRHYLDFFYGVNASRALTLAIKKHAKRFSILTAGRVQGPVLSMLAEKENEISKFKPKPYWQIEMKILDNVIANFEKNKIWDEKEAKKIFSSCKIKKAIIDKIDKKEYKQNPPVPFNITSLQTESYRLFGYSPQQTMRIAQELYTKAFISYPRTSSEKLPPQIGYKEIISALAKLGKYKKLCNTLLKKDSLATVEGKKTDAAHEAIHPTNQPPSSLTGPRQKIYDLICRRFLSGFAEYALRESVKLTLLVNKNKFTTTGRRTIKKGWMEYYGSYAKFDEVIIPDVNEKDKIDIKKMELLSKETSPPPRYSQASIIKKMEKKGLGTRATRSSIIQTLYDRNYVEGKNLTVTVLGMKVASVLKKYVPDLIDEKLTRKFEKELEKLANGKIKKTRILKQAETAIRKISKEFMDSEDKIGKKLGGAVIETQNNASILGKCKCGGDLKMLFNPFTKKKFVGCSMYSRCKKCGFTKTACKCICKCGKQKGKCKCSWKDKKWEPSCQVGYPLPGMAVIQKTEKICNECGTPIIQVIRKGKRPFRMCLDTECKTKADWGKDKKNAKVIKKKIASKKKAAKPKKISKKIVKGKSLMS